MTSVLLSVAVILLFHTVQAAYVWKGLSYDPPNFVCENFVDLCTNYLDSISCGTNPTDRVNIGCPGYPEIPNDITRFVGSCKCFNPIFVDDGGSRIINELMSNRIVPDMGWLLEPWKSAPPYDLVISFKRVCSILLHRSGCPVNSHLINATMLPTYSSGVPSQNFHCQCGSYKPEKSVLNVVIDQINKSKLSVMPIFASPVYLSCALSLCLVLILGKLGAIVAMYFKLPALVGYILVGLGIQNFLHPMILKGPGFPIPSAASELRLLAMVLVLMRAGMAVSSDDIFKLKVPTFVLTLIPYMSEFFAFMYIGVKLLGWSELEMGLYASIMAAVGPSVVIPQMLTFLSSTKYNFGYVPKQVMICAPLEAVMAIIMFSIFSNLNMTEPDPLYPWVQVLPLYANCLLIPLNLAFSIVLGVIIGYGCAAYMNYRVKVKSDYLWLSINKNPQMGSNTGDLVFILLVACYTAISLCTKQYIQQCSGVLVVFTICVTCSKILDPAITNDIAAGLKGIWVFAEVFLFVLVGTQLVLDFDNGPLVGQRGMPAETLSNVCICMFVSSFFRYVGTVLVSPIMAYSQPAHRQTVGWMGRFSLATYIMQLPKATVHATLGGLAYALHIIPGTDGLNKSIIIAQSCPFAILIFAIAGNLLTVFVAGPLCLKMAEIDETAGWNIGKYCYKKSSPYYISDGKDEFEAEEPQQTDAVDEVEHYVKETVVTVCTTKGGMVFEEPDGKIDPVTFLDTISRLRAFSSTPDHSSANAIAAAAASPAAHEVSSEGYTRARSGSEPVRARKLSNAEYLHRKHGDFEFTAVPTAPVGFIPDHIPAGLLPVEEGDEEARSL